MPALFTSTSMRPHFAASARRRLPPRSRRSATFTFWKNASPPAAAISSVTAAAFVSCTSHAATRHFSFANPTAVARPMPAPAPVTMTTFPASPVSMLMMAILSLSPDSLGVLPEVVAQGFSSANTRADS